jgi:hypothetical protein
MFQALFLVLYLTTHALLGSICLPKTGGGVDPNGIMSPAPPSTNSGGGVDPDGRTSPNGDTGGGVSPDGRT